MRGWGKAMSELRRMSPPAIAPFLQWRQKKGSNLRRLCPSGAYDCPPAIRSAGACRARPSFKYLSQRFINGYELL